jgi:hypothetical protein
MTRYGPFKLNKKGTKAMKSDLCGSDSSEPPTNAQAESQSEKKRGLSVLEILGLIIFALAFLWLLWLCGLPPTDLTEWPDWFLHGSGSVVNSPWKFLFLFCVLWWLLILKRNKQ